MSRYTLIEKELSVINDARFQIICNAFLAQEYRGDIQSLGTSTGKEKTRKGRPDTFIKQEDGTYILAEYTTRDKSHNTKTFLKKLQTDLKSCLNFEKLGIRANQIATIVICCNSKLSPSDNEALQEIIAAHKIKLRPVGIDTLTLFLLTSGQLYAHHYLNIPFDTGQILSKNDFLKFYSKGNLAAPLNNPLIGRQKECLSLVDTIEKNKIVVVSGHAGVGKSRLCLQAIDDFLDKHSTYTAYYLVYKTGSIAEELSAIMETGKNYIFFIDDANRQINNLLTVIYSPKNTDGNSFKIVITVRNYVKEEILRACKISQLALFHLPKLNNKTIAEIISGDGFNITMPVYLTRIVEISNGNPRIAVMAARIIQSRPDIKLLKDVSTIYDEYFQSIIDDKHIFANQDTLKAIGLISFFYSLDLETDSIRRILTQFHMSYDNFVEAVLVLQDTELVEVYLRFIVRISEQILAAYFFYKVFIKEKLLNFETLLSQCCNKYYGRMKDITGPVYASFGEREALNNIKGILISHFNTIQSDLERSLNFLQVFGTSIPDQTFVFISKYIRMLDAPETSNFSHKDVGQDHIDSHPVIKTLAPFFKNGKIHEAITAVELSLMYIERTPHAFDALFFQLRHKFAFTYFDISNNFYRQNELYINLLNGLGKGIAHERLFFYLFKEILLSNLNQKYFYIKKPDDWHFLEPIKELRSRFWNDLSRHFNQHPQVCRITLERYIEHLPQTNVKLLRYDEIFVYTILVEHLDPGSFEDCQLVHQYLSILYVYYPPSPLLKKLKSIFTSEAVVVFNTFNAENFFDRHSQGWELNEKKIQGFTINNINDFKKVYSLLLESFPFWKERNKMKYTLGFWLSTIFRKAPLLGLKVLQFIIADGNKLGIYPYDIFKVVFTLPVIWHEQIFTLIKSNSFNGSDNWLNEYFSNSGKEFSSESLMHEAMHFYTTGKSLSCIYTHHIDKFLSLDNEIHEKLLLLLFSRIKRGDQFDFGLDVDFFSINKMLSKKNFQICKQIYFHLKETQYQFDSFLSAFFSLYEVDNSILFDYINYLESKNELICDENGEHLLSKVWSHTNPSKIMEQVIVKLKVLEVSTYRRHPSCLFFHYLDEQDKVKVNAFLKGMIENHNKDTVVLNIIFNIARACLKENFLDLVKHLLTVNHSFSVFKNILWAAAAEECYDYTSSLELMVAQLHKVYEAVSELPQPSRYIEHRNDLAQQIYVLQENMKQHQKWDFMDGYYKHQQKKEKYYS